MDGLKGVIVVLAVIFACYHEIHVLQSKSNPPLSCAFTGGNWNIITGWNC